MDFKSNINKFINYLLHFIGIYAIIALSIGNVTDNVAGNVFRDMVYVTMRRFVKIAQERVLKNIKQERER